MQRESERSTGNVVLVPMYLPFWEGRADICRYRTFFDYYSVHIVHTKSAGLILIVLVNF